MEFQFGDKVGFGFANDAGIVKDKLRSTKGYTVYLVEDEGGGERFFTEDELKPIEEAVTYCYELEHHENIVVARFYEVRGDDKTEIARGHGHVIHEGAFGVAQAASYALKRIYMQLGGES